MRRKSPYTVLLAALISLLMVCVQSWSQPSNVMYFMKGVPQSNLMNPAFQPTCGFYLGMPGLSPLMIDIENNPIKVHDILFYSPVDTAPISFLHPNADKNKFLSIFGNNNFIHTDISTDLASFGFRAGSLYFSFGIIEKAFVRLNYPKDLFTLPLYGLLDKNLNPTTLDLSGIAVNSSAYTEISMGVSKNIGDLLSIGVRGKVLLGEANLYMKTTDISINTGLKEWKIKSKLDLYASIPLYQIPKDSTGKFDFNKAQFDTSLNSTYVSNRDKVNKIIDVFRKPNMGMAFDIGFNIKPLEWLSISASVVDLGYIHWKRNTFNLKQDTTYTFKGIDVSGNISGKDTGDIGQKLLDTLKGVFSKYNAGYPTYNTNLPVKIYVGATFNLSEKVSFGLLSMTELYLNKTRQSLSLSANLMPIRMFSASLCYSIIDNKYHDFGVGLSFKSGPFNMYYIFDYLPTTYDKLKKSKDIPFDIPLPVYTRSFSMKIGLNLVFGCNRKKKLLKDVPLIE